MIHHAAERKTPSGVYPSRDVATQFARFESGAVHHLGYVLREGLPLADPWRERVERTPADHTVITAAIAQWHSRLNACLCVNGEHFGNKFWACDFLLSFVCFIDTGFRKCDRYKHVQSANICVKCVTFVSETLTQYGSNITNVWQEILCQWLWHALAKLCTKNYDNPSIFVNVTAKKIVAPFFWTWCSSSSWFLTR